MSDPEKEVMKALLSEASGDTDRKNLNGDTAGPTESGHKTSFIVGSDSESTSLAGDDASKAVIQGLSDKTQSGSAEPSPSRGFHSSTGLHPRSKDAESIRSGAELDKNSSKSSLRGPVLTEPVINILADPTPGGEMRKSYSEHIPMVRSNTMFALHTDIRITIVVIVVDTALQYTKWVFIVCVNVFITFIIA